MNSIRNKLTASVAFQFKVFNLKCENSSLMGNTLKENRRNDYVNCNKTNLLCIRGHLYITMY